MKGKLKKSRNAFSGLFKDSAVRWFDWLILFILMAFCFFSFNMRDLLHTAGCSYGYLDGHFRGFYDYLAEYGVDEHGGQGLFAAYLPTIYLMFAVWNLPMKIFGVVPSATSQLNIIALMWAKILPCLFYLGCGLLVFKICRKLKMQDRKAKVVMFSFLSMPLAFTGQFILGNYESFLLLFVLLGVLSWLNKKDVMFVFWFSLAFSCKYTAILIFLPLLLLREKRIFRILLMTAGLFVIAGLEFFVYRNSPAFRANVFGIGASGDAPVVTGYIFNSVINIGFEWDHKQLPVYLTFVAFAFVIAYAYFTHCKDEKEEGRYAMYILCLSASAFFCLSKWHPQWLLLGIPFWVITASVHRDAKIFPVIDLILGVLFMMFMVTHFQGICDEVMLKNGVFKYIMMARTVNPAYSLHNMIGFLDMNTELTLITAILAVYAVFKHPKYMNEDMNISIDKTMAGIRVRTLVPLLFFLIPAVYCAFMSVSF